MAGASPAPPPGPAAAVVVGKPEAEGPGGLRRAEGAPGPAAHRRRCSGALVAVDAPRGPR